MSVSACRALLEALFHEYGIGDDREVPKESAAGKGQKRKRDTKPSGEPAVKRAASALQMFMRQRRPELQQSQPGLKAPEQQRIMAAEFKALSDEERKPFEEEAVNERRALEEAKQQGAPCDMCGSVCLASVLGVLRRMSFGRLWCVCVCVLSFTLCCVEPYVLSVVFSGGLGGSAK